MIEIRYDGKRPRQAMPASARQGSDMDRATRAADFEVIKDKIEGLCSGIIDLARIYCDDEGFQLIDLNAQMIFERLEQIGYIVHDLRSEA